MKVAWAAECNMHAYLHAGCRTRTVDPASML